LASAAKVGPAARRPNTRASNSILKIFITPPRVVILPAPWTLF
jgi:hypothetical protein